MTTFVLIHGAFHGGWCWERLAAELGDGAEVFAPTLAGLAERADLLSEEIDLDTHVEEVIELLRSQDLHDVVLVGHSYGGAVITRVADAEHDRLRAIVYLDAYLPADGQSVLQLTAGGEDTGRAARLGAAAGEATMQVPPAEVFGLSGEDARWVQERMTPQPLATLLQVVHLENPAPAELVPRRAYVWASGWTGVPHFKESFDALAESFGWTTVELDSSHDLMIDRTREVADLLREMA